MTPASCFIGAYLMYSDDPLGGILESCAHWNTLLLTWKPWGKLDLLSGVNLKYSLALPVGYV